MEEGGEIIVNPFSGKENLIPEQMHASLDPL
jgi:hypothetical protein